MNTQIAEWSSAKSCHQGIYINLKSDNEVLQSSVLGSLF